MRVWLLGAVCGLQMGTTPGQDAAPRQALNGPPPVLVVVRADHEGYGIDDVVNLDISIRSTGGETIYIDRRLFWGYGGGLVLEVSDEGGNSVPAPIRNDALMFPPKEGDASILVRLDRGYFYGTSLSLPVRDRFPKAGKYRLRVTYKSWLRKSWVLPQFRDLPALWADSDAITSEPVWIEVAR